MVEAVRSMKREWIKEASDKVRALAESLDPSKPFKSNVRVVTGPEAEAIADKPHLTGDPEWDAVELEETNSNREPFDRSRFF